MSEQTYYQEFKGYWRDQYKSSLPEASGVYCVYEGSYNSSTDKVTLLNLIYIGESENIHNRVSGHEKYNEWLRYVRYGNELMYSYTLVGAANRERVEATLIYEHKPPVNTEYKNSFPFDTTTINTSGRNALLKPYFTVYSTTNSFAGYFYR